MSDRLTPRRNLTMPDEIWEAMEARANRSHRSISAEIRAACLAWLDAPATPQRRAVNLPVKALVYLAKLPTLTVGHFDDLLIDAPTVRVWRSRLTTADGAPEDGAITVERMTPEGTWAEGTKAHALEAIAWHRDGSHR